VSPLAGLQTDNFRLTSCWGSTRLAKASSRTSFFLHIIYKRARPAGDLHTLYFIVRNSKVQSANLIYIGGRLERKS